LRRQRNQRRNEEFAQIRDAYEDEAYREALGVDAEQWTKIKPLIARINELRVLPFLKFSVYGFASGGSRRSHSASHYGGSGGSGSARSMSYAFGSGSGSPPPRPGRGGRYVAGGNASVSSGASGYGYSAGGGYGAGGAAGGGTGGYGFNAGGAGTGPERPVKKQVGDLNLGWMWRRPSDGKRPEDVTEGDKVCESLLDAIQAKSPDPQATQERVEALRLIREQKRAELRQVRQELRALVTPEQEAKLILMGYLD
jgi:hypothetical protein